MALTLPLDLGMDHPATNRVVDEPHEITTQASRFFVPQGGPFFALGLQLKDSTNNLLRPGIDYLALHLDFDATKATGKEVDSIIYVKNTAIAGTVKLSCHYVGGEYSATTDALEQILSDLVVGGNDQFVWGNVLNKPVQYPPVAHQHHIRNLFGTDEMVTVLEGIRKAILEGDGGTLNAIFQYLDQKHQQHVDSLPSVYATQAAVQAALNTHVQASNAHPKSAVGLGNVDNYATATLAEAQAGTPVDKFVTLRRLMDRLIAMRATVADIFAGTALDKTLAPVNLRSIGQKLFSTAGALNPDPNVTLDSYFATSHANAGGPAGVIVNILQFFTTSAEPTVNTPRKQIRIGANNASKPSLATRTFSSGVWSPWAALLSSADIQADWLEDETQVIAQNVLNTHLNASNAHSKSAVGLGNVPNWTPLASNDATAAGANGKTTSFISADAALKLITNRVTNTWLGLNNVDNYPTVTQTEAQAGTVVDKFVTMRRLIERLTAIRATATDIFAGTAADKTLAPINQRSIGQKLFSTPSGQNPDPNVTLDAYFATAHANAGGPEFWRVNILQFFTTSAEPTVNTPRTQYRIGPTDATTPSLAMRSFVNGVWSPWSAFLSPADIQVAWQHYEQTRIYYVGSLYFNTINANNPASILGYGTWTRISGRAIVGLQAGDSDFGTLGQTGGEKTHTLTIAEMPDHRHAIHGIGKVLVGSANAASEPYGAAYNTILYTDPLGGGAPHNNLQPYYVASVWRRVA